MKNKISIKEEFKNSFLAGVLISIGGTVYISCQNKIVGAFLFSIALFCICVEGLSLYTGKVCYFLKTKEKINSAINLLICLIGNLCAVVFCAIILKYHNISINEASNIMCNLKLEKNFIRVFVDSVFCGILIYLAVNIYREHKSIIGIFICIPVFILSGFEHCIADAFYFSLTDCLMPLKSLIFTSIVIFGNSVGGLIFPYIKEKF